MRSLWAGPRVRASPGRRGPARPAGRSATAAGRNRDASAPAQPRAAQSGGGGACALRVRDCRRMRGRGGCRCRREGSFPPTRCVRRGVPVPVPSLSALAARRACGAWDQRCRWALRAGALLGGVLLEGGGAAPPRPPAALRRERWTLLWGGCCGRPVPGVPSGGSSGGGHGLDRAPGLPYVCWGGWESLWSLRPASQCLCLSL